MRSKTNGTYLIFQQIAVEFFTSTLAFVDDWVSEERYRQRSEALGVSGRYAVLT